MGAQALVPASTAECPDGAVDTHSFTSTVEAVRACAQNIREHGQARPRPKTGGDEDAGEV